MGKQIEQKIGYILLFVLGLAILAYPSVADWWNTKQSNQLITEYDAIVEQMDDQDLEAFKQVAQRYNANLISNILPDAFAEEEANSPNKEYEAILNVGGDGFMGAVEIPVINVKLPIYHYTTEEVLQKGVGHLPGSSIPIGGESTHSVLSAHRGLPSAKLFTDLDKVQEGNVFYLHVLNETLAYQVDLIKVIEPTDTSDLSIIEGKDYCTLFTCTPYAVNSHRLLVRGYRIPYTEEGYISETNATAGMGDTNVLVIRILCVILGTLIAALIAWFLNRKNKPKGAGKKNKEEVVLPLEKRALPYISEVKKHGRKK